MYYIFVNPASKSGSGAALWSEAEILFKERNIPYEVHFTKKDESIRSDYEDILAKTEERPVKLIILGGDGTLNQVIQGITHPEETELSLIRNGSGMTFRAIKIFPPTLKTLLTVY